MMSHGSSDADLYGSNEATFAGSAHRHFTADICGIYLSSYHLLHLVTVLSHLNTVNSFHFATLISCLLRLLVIISYTRRHLTL